MSFGYGFGPRARRRGVIAGGGGGEPPPPSSDVAFVGLDEAGFDTVDQHTLDVPGSTQPGDELVLLTVGLGDPPVDGYPDPPAGWFMFERRVNTGSGQYWRRGLRRVAPDPVPATIVVGEELDDYGEWRAALLVYRNGRLMGNTEEDSGANWLNGSTNETNALDGDDGLALDLITVNATASSPPPPTPAFSTDPASTSRINNPGLLAAERSLAAGEMDVTHLSTGVRGYLHRYNVLPNDLAGNLDQSARQLPSVVGNLGCIIAFSRGSAPAAPSGWDTTISVESGSSNLHMQLRVFTKVLDGSEDPDLLFDRSSAQDRNYLTVDCDPTAIEAATDTDTLVAPSVDAPGPGLLLTFCTRRDALWPSGSAPADTSSIFVRSNASNEVNGIVAIERIEEAGPTGTRTFVSDGGHASRMATASLFLPDAEE